MLTDWKIFLVLKLADILNFPIMNLKFGLLTFICLSGSGVLGIFLLFVMNLAVCSIGTHLSQ